VDNPQTLTRDRRTREDVHSITNNHAEAQSARRGWAVSLRTLRLCVNIFPERGLHANVVATIGFCAEHSMRIGHKELPILRFLPDSALSEALKPQGTHAQPNRYPVSTHGKLPYSGGLHFFCNKIANGC
jgi:hypothetical protein